MLWVQPPQGLALGPFTQRSQRRQATYCRGGACPAQETWEPALRFGDNRRPVRDYRCSIKKSRPFSLLLALGLAALACGSDVLPPDVQPAAGTPLVGFTFSPEALPAGEDPLIDLRRLLWHLSPDLVRLPVYWESVAPAPTQVDFSQIDALVATVAAYDAASAHHQTRIVLVAGARNVLTPEVHLPDWAQGDSALLDLLDSHPYHQYLLLTFKHYARSPLLYGWQVENEPLDSTNPDLGPVDLPASAVQSEIQLLRRIDPIHPIVVTTYDSAAVNIDKVQGSRWEWLWDLLPWNSRPVGHPGAALALGDALGLDVYVVTPSTPLDQASPQVRIGWKGQALAYWAQRAAQHGKSLWITEMQAAPWQSTAGFTTDDLLDSARVYRDSGAEVVLLWGVETWLDSPDWMAAGQEAMATLRD